MFRAVGVIPARYKSSRFEGKVIADLFGKPLVRWVWEVAQEASTLEKVVIACDDERVGQVCRKFGAETMMTSPEHASGTDRVCEAVSGIAAQIVVNIQADEPLLKPSMIDDLVVALEADKDVEVATLIKRIEDEREIDSPDVVKAVVDRHLFALYFSRSPVPFNRDAGKGSVYYKHIGMYAYRKDFLFTFKNLPPSGLEKTEKLEQLRILEAGLKIKTVLTQFDTLGVDTRGDLEAVKRYLKELGHA